MEYYAAEIKKEHLSFAMAEVEVETIMLSKISQLEKDKSHL